MGEPSPPAGRPSLVDLAHQRALRLAYLGLRVWWGLARPRTRGAFVGVWYGRRVLLIQNSYVPYRSFPGGGIRRGEEPAAAAARECAEEVGLSVSAADLELDFEMDQSWEGKRDTVWMYRLRLSSEPTLRVDHREVLAAAFVEVGEALERPLFAPARRHVESVVSSGTWASAGPVGGGPR